MSWRRPLRLYLTDHRSAAISLARALSADPTIDDHQIELDNGDVILWIHHHLLYLAPPEHYKDSHKNWLLEDLPIVPEQFRLQARNDGHAIINRVKKALLKASTVYHCGSPDREGQLAIDQLLIYLRYQGEVLRAWLTEMAPNSIKHSIESARPNSEYRRLSQAALARSRTDWLIGINLTRACTLVAERDGFDGVLTFGRVQTPVLAMIVARDLAIEQGLEPESPIQLERQGVHSLASLQRLMFKEHGLMPADVLVAAEGLYYRLRVISSPYTDSHHLPSALKASQANRLNAISKNLGLSPLGQLISPYDTLQTDQGIVPTEVFAEPVEFEPNERLVYDVICRQYLGYLQGAGALPQYADTRGRYTELSLMQALESVKPWVHHAEIKQRISSAIGFGATRTRALQIEGLVKRDYIVRGRQHLVSTQAGRDLIGAIANNLGSADFLARWELGLQEIERGQLTYTAYMKALVSALETWVQRIDQSQIIVRSAQDVLSDEPVAIELHCPKCERTLVRRSSEKGDFLGCSGYPECSYTRKLLSADKRAF